MYIISKMAIVQQPAYAGILAKSNRWAAGSHFEIWFGKYTKPAALSSLILKTLFFKNIFHI